MISSKFYLKCGRFSLFSTVRDVHYQILGVYQERVANPSMSVVLITSNPVNDNLRLSCMAYLELYGSLNTSQIIQDSSSVSKVKDALKYRLQRMGQRKQGGFVPDMPEWDR